MLFGFWRGQRLREIEPRLKPGGKYEMATFDIREGVTVKPAVATRLTKEAVALNSDGRRPDEDRKGEGEEGRGEEDEGGRKAALEAVLSWQSCRVRTHHFTVPMGFAALNPPYI